MLVLKLRMIISIHTGLDLELPEENTFHISNKQSSKIFKLNLNLENKLFNKKI